MTESLMFDNNGTSRFRSRSNQDYERQTITAVKSLMPSFASLTNTNSIGITTDYKLPEWLQTAVDALTTKPLSFILKKDNKYTLDVADEELSDSEYFHLLRIVGAHMDEFKNSDLKKYFNTSEHLFEQTIWSTGELSKFIENVVSFCALAENGYINMTALTSILSTLLKTELAQSQETINKIETCIIYSEKNKECGVIKLHFTGDQIKVKGCCSSEGANTKINVKKDLIIFKDSKELLLSLRTFARKYR